MAEQARPARIALIDSGINPADPRLHGVEIIAGPRWDDAGVRRQQEAPTDRLGHGSAVAAAILEHTATATFFALTVFDDAPDCPFAHVLDALDCALDWGPDLVNLSLGTGDPDFADVLAERVARARERGARIVAPASLSGLPSWPGALPGVESVLEDPNLPPKLVERRELRGRTYWFASPREPGRPGGRQATGISIATGRVTGHLARTLPR